MSLWVAPSIMWSPFGSFAFLITPSLQKNVSALEPAMTGNGFGETVSFDLHRDRWA